jgi:hypothetical protein
MWEASKAVFSSKRQTGRRGRTPNGGAVDSVAGPGGNGGGNFRHVTGNFLQNLGNFDDSDVFPVASLAITSSQFIETDAAPGFARSAAGWPAL